MAVMTGSLHERVLASVPAQRDLPAARPVTVLRISSDAMPAPTLLLPATSGTADIAPLLPVQRDRRARRARRGSTRRLTVVAVAFGLSLAVWTAIIAAVAALARAL